MGEHAESSGTWWIKARSKPGPSAAGSWTSIEAEREGCCPRSPGERPLGRRLPIPAGARASCPILDRCRRNGTRADEDWHESQAAQVIDARAAAAAFGCSAGFPRPCAIAAQRLPCRGSSTTGFESRRTAYYRLLELTARGGMERPD